MPYSFELHKKYLIKIILASTAVIILYSRIAPVDLSAQDYSFEEIKENLYRERPQSGDTEIRKQSICSLDPLIFDNYSGNETEGFNEINVFLKDMFNKTINEIKNEIVSEGVTIWQIYNMGFVVKTPSLCFGFDLCNYFHSDRFLELAELLDALFISHLHIDHYSSSLTNKMMSLGKPVAGPPDKYPARINLPMNAGDTSILSNLKVVAHYGSHSVDARQFEVTTSEGITFLHTGDNGAIDNIPIIDGVDILMLNAWIADVNSAIYRVNPGATLPGHFCELSHTVNALPWGAAFELDDSNVSGDYCVLAWGERYHYDNTSNDTIRPNLIENPTFKIQEQTIDIAWDQSQPAQDGDTASFYRIIVNKTDERFILERQFTLEWDSVGNYPVQVYSYDDCGNQSQNYVLINARVPDINYAPRITSCYPNNIDSVDVYSGVYKVFNINALDPNNDFLTYTWEINDQALQDEDSPIFVYKMPGLEAGFHTLTATVSDQQTSGESTWLINYDNRMAIVDEEDTIMYAVKGDWRSHYSLDAYQEQFQTSLNTSYSTSIAQYMYYPELEGNYEVSVHIPHYSGATTCAWYTISVNDQRIDNTTVNQRVESTAWIPLGQYHYPRQAEVKVRVINNSNSSGDLYLIADAVKFIYKSETSDNLYGYVDQSELIVYPNPANDLTTIETKISGLHTVSITSMNSKLIYFFETDEPTLQIDLSSFQKGVYFITVRSRDYVRTEKIIKF